MFTISSYIPYLPLWSTAVTSASESKIPGFPKVACQICQF